MFFRRKKKETKKIDVFNYKTLNSKAINVSYEFSKMVNSFKDKTEMFQKGNLIIDKKKEVIPIY